MTYFNHCPNCHTEPSGGFFGELWFKIWECEDCQTLYCWHCGAERCPECGSKRATEVGECWGRPKP